MVGGGADKRHESVRRPEAVGKCDRLKVEGTVNRRRYWSKLMMRKIVDKKSKEVMEKGVNEMKRRMVDG